MKGSLFYRLIDIKVYTIQFYKYKKENLSYKNASILWLTRI